MGGRISRLTETCQRSAERGTPRLRCLRSLPITGGFSELCSSPHVHAGAPRCSSPERERLTTNNESEKEGFPEANTGNFTLGPRGQDGHPWPWMAAREGQCRLHSGLSRARLRLLHLGDPTTRRLNTDLGLCSSGTAWAERQGPAAQAPEATR